MLKKIMCAFGAFSVIAAIIGIAVTMGLETENEAERTLAAKGMAEYILEHQHELQAAGFTPLVKEAKELKKNQPDLFKKMPQHSALHTTPSPDRRMDTEKIKN